MTAASGADTFGPAGGFRNAGRLSNSANPPASGADQPIHTAPGIREQMIERLLEADLGLFEAEQTADLLLPLLEADRERAKAEGGAEALEQAAERADTWARLSAPGDAERAYEHVHSYLRARARATALRGSTGGGQ